MTDYTPVTQEMWDRAQAALRAALPVIEAQVPKLSTSGTMVSLRNQIRDALWEPMPAPETSAIQICENCTYPWQPGPQQCPACGHPVSEERSR